MAIIETAKNAVLEAADRLEKIANSFGILRSVEATTVAAWLDHIAEELRVVCTDDPAPSDEEKLLPMEVLEGALTLQYFQSGGLPLEYALLAKELAQIALVRLNAALALRAVSDRTAKEKE
jgi:hypothetical protein